MDKRPCAALVPKELVIHVAPFIVPRDVVAHNALGTIGKLAFDVAVEEAGFLDFNVGVIILEIAGIGAGQVAGRWAGSAAGWGA